MGGLVGHFHGFPFPFPLSSTAPLPCKTPLLLLGIVGLTAALLEIEKGLVAISIKKLQNIYKHHLFHLGHRVRYKRDSTLDQVGVVLGSELNPRKVSILSLLS
jgi:hypothetical protein